MSIFTLPTDPGERISQALAQRVCTTSDCASYIRVSGGRSRTGRLTKYTVHLGDGSFFTLRAKDDSQAVEAANQHLSRKEKNVSGT